MLSPVTARSSFLTKRYARPRADRGRSAGDGRCRRLSSGSWITILPIARSDRARASTGAVPTRPATAPAATAEVRYHTVAEGDSLSRISMRYYGTPNRWQEIYNANRDVLQASSVLRVGMQLRIP